MQAAVAGLPVRALSYSAPVRYLVVELEGDRVGPRELAELRPDFGKLRTAVGAGTGVAEDAVSGVIVCLVTPERIYSRFFGPWMGERGPSGVPP